MANLRYTVLSIAIATMTLGAFAHTGAEHTQHHTAGAAKNVTKAVAPKAPSMAKESMAAMEGQMKTMREMHEKMMVAKTPDERKALMGDHMKAMQDGMAVMENMGSADTTSGMDAGTKKGGMSMDMMAHHEMMEKRMEMMTTMMQMMMDRMPVPAVP